MAVTIVSFRWLEILEKEFDKNFVDLDLLIGDLDAEEPDFVYSARQKLAGLSSCFAQLTHKAQTIFQNSAKVEAELLDLRTELVNSKTRQEILEEESRSLVLQLHSLQLDRLPSNQNPEQYKEKIETALKLSPTKSAYSEEITFRNNSEIKKLKNELLQYQSENIILRNSILALHSEVYGARLAAKYLDKELAGRIQQLQLLGREMRTDERDKLWRQLESEILLHRHKTVIRACRNRTNHEFIQTDSRILNFNHSDSGRCFRSECSSRQSNSLSNNFGGGNSYRHLDHSLMMKKSEPFQRRPGFDDSNRNGLGKNSEYSNESKRGIASKEKEESSTENNVRSLNNSLRSAHSEEKEPAVEEESELAENEKISFDEKTDEEKPREEDSPKVALAEDKKNGSIDGEEFSCLVGEKRTVIVKRMPEQGLGISITGGREHGVPILISELEVGGPAHECRNLFVGDAILKVNDISLENASHFEAVKILTNLETNNVKLLVQFIAVDTDEENSLSEDLYGYRYRFFDTEVMDSSDALGLHPLHSNSAHTPTAPRTPDFARNDSYERGRCRMDRQIFYGHKPSNLPEKESGSAPEKHQEDLSGNLIEIDSDLGKSESERLKIDLFGFKFQTGMTDVFGDDNENPLNDFLVEKGDNVKAEGDLIQIEVTDSKPSAPGKKFEYVDENIFSGLEDNSILDNIIKSFSEDDFSYLDAEKEKNVTSDSGLEVCLSGSDVDVDKMFMEERCREKDYVGEWMSNAAAEKVEVKTLQQIFDRSFSSNLSSPRGSTSFDDDILSTEQSDEKSNSLTNFKNKAKDAKSNYNTKKMQKLSLKASEVAEEALKNPAKVEPPTTTTTTTTAAGKNDAANGKKTKRNGFDTLKRNKSGRKSKETKKKNVLSEDFPKTNESHKKRELNYKITDRFDENLIEYNVKSYDLSQLSPIEKEDSEPEKKLPLKEEPPDEIEETRKLSRRYGLKIPGKGIKSEPNSSVSPAEAKSPERCIKILESHFKHFKPVLENSVKPTDKENAKAKSFRCSRYDSFGDPDFGTPV